MAKVDFNTVFDLLKGKKIFITGHTGFKGTWLTFILTEIGANVRGYALEPEEGPSHFKMLGLENKIDHIIGDVRDSSKLISSLTDFKPEIVFHLAAQPLVKKSYNDPVETFSTNVMGSVNLLEAVRESNTVKSLVYITSDKCYENVEWIWGYRENDMVGGRDPYSASKGAAEIVFSSYLRSYFDMNPLLGAASTRAGNVIGGGDWSVDRIIPDIVRAIENKKPLVLRNPKATRPWQHVLEPLSGYLLLAYNLYKEPKKYSGSWNFGPSGSEVKTVEEISKIMIQHFGEGTIELENAGDTHEAQLLHLNCDKAHQVLNWHPRWNSDETLETTAEWYKWIHDERDAEVITRKQIQNYFKEIKK